MDESTIIYLQVKQCNKHRDQLLNNARQGTYYLTVDIEDISSFDDELSTTVVSEIPR